LRPLAAQTPLAAYACKHKLPEIRGESSSGGVFYAAASCVIERGGAVFGAAMDERNRCVHICAENLTDLKQMMGSKYVQSDINNTYAAVKKYLRQNRAVLFTGTPCQTAGLTNFLKKDYENLFCLCIICHGVPSPLVFESYLKSLESRTQSRITGVKFRNKLKNWDLVDSMRIEKTDGVQMMKQDSFLLGFHNNLYLRPSCHHCKANNFRSGADMILGDYWGGFIKLKDFDDGKGVSALIINTEKGGKLFSDINSRLDYKQAAVDDIRRFNPCLAASVRQSPNRAAFFKALETDDDFSAAAKKFIKVTPANRLKRILGYKTVYRLLNKIKRGELNG